MTLWHTRRNVVELIALAVAAAGWLAWANTTECRIHTILAEIPSARQPGKAPKAPTLAERARMLAGLRWPAQRDIRQLPDDLAALGAPAMPALLELALHAERHEVYWITCCALEKIGVSVDRLAAVVADAGAGETARLRAIGMLTYRGPEAREAIPALLKAMREEKSYRRFWFADAVTAIDHPLAERVVLPLVMEQLNHRNETWTAFYAERSLLKIGPVTEAARARIQYMADQGHQGCIPGFVLTHKPGESQECY
ncbi:MAG: hypothetical protein NTV86_03495 [Planctomycetota bacterium]|nr:hypothetical protein [Planctomycetota bacterium]